MVDILQIEQGNHRQVRDFLDLPKRLYRHSPTWVPPLEGEERNRLDPRRNPFFKHSTAAFFVAYRDSLPVGRLAVLDNRLHNEHNHERTAFFTLFECEHDLESAEALFERASAWARERGLERLFGPKGFTALDGLGMLVKGYDLRPAMGLAYNPPYYPEMIERLGFTKVHEIVSGYLGADIAFPERIHELAERIQARRGLHIAIYHSRAELRGALGHLLELYNEALHGTSGGTPLTTEEFKSLVNQMLWFADPQLIKIVMKDERPVGFLLAYPDISAAIQKIRGRLFPFGWLLLLRALKTTEWININGAGMVEEYRGLGGTAILYSQMFKSISGNERYHHAEVVQIGLENEKMLREMTNFGVDFCKMHRTYQKDLI